MASLFDRAIESGYDQPEVYLQRARVRSRNNDPAGGSEDALHVLQMDSVPPPLVWEAVSLIRPDESKAIAASPAVMSLDVGERLSLADGLKEWHEIETSMRILEPIVGDADVPDAIRQIARCGLAMRYIATGKCGAAARLIGDGGRSIDDMDMGDAFDYGMATWGVTGKVVPKPFVRVVVLDQSEPGNPSYLQRMAVAYWAAGEEAAAAEFQKRARETLRSADSEFSFWRYAEVPANEFKEDLDDILALIGGDTSRIPRFMRSRSVAGTRG